MTVPHWLLLLFCLSVICQIVLGIMFPTSPAGSLQRVGRPVAYATEVIGAAIPAFVFGGIAPGIYWAIRRFSGDATKGVMIAWGLLMAVFVWLQYYGLSGN
jgi:hypothetical protein